MNISELLNYECVSLYDMLELMGITDKKKPGIETLKNYLRELTPNCVYSDSVAGSDVLNDDMIIDAARNTDECIHAKTCLTKCPKSNSYFNCFIIDAAIKYDTIRKANDYSDMLELTPDCYYSADEDEKLYYIRGNFYDYIYYIITHNKRNGRGTGARSDHFMSRYHKFVFPGDYNSKDFFLSEEFLGLFDNFLNNHNIVIDDALINTVVSTYPEACRLAIDTFPSRNLTGRELIAVLIAEAVSSSYYIKQMLRQRAESSTENDQHKSLEDRENKTRVTAILRNLSIKKRIFAVANITLTVVSVVFCILSLFFFRGDLLPDLDKLHGIFPFFLLAQALLFPLNYYIGLKRRLITLFIEKSRNAAFFEYVVRNYKHNISLPGLGYITPGFSLPYFLEYKTSRFLIFAFTGIIAIILFVISMVYSSIYLMSAIMPFVIIAMMIIDSVIDSKTLFLSYDRLSNLLHGNHEDSVYSVGKYKMFDIHTESFDGIYSDTETETEGLPGRAIRYIYFNAYQTRRENATTLIFLITLANIFCFMSTVFISDASMTMITTLLTLGLTLFYQVIPSRHNYLSRLISYKYKALFHPAQKLSDTYSRDIRKKLITRYDITSGKKVYLRTLIYETGNSLSDKNASGHSLIPDSLRFSYVSFFRYSQGRKVFCCLLLFFFACTSFFLLINIKMLAIISIILCLIAVITIKLGIFDFILPLPTARHFEKKLRSYLDRKADQSSRD